MFIKLNSFHFINIIRRSEIAFLVLVLEIIGDFFSLESLCSLDSFSTSTRSSKWRALQQINMLYSTNGILKLHINCMLDRYHGRCLFPRDTHRIFFSPLSIRALIVALNKIINASFVNRDIFFPIFQSTTKKCNLNNLFSAIHLYHFN